MTEIRQYQDSDLGALTTQMRLLQLYERQFDPARAEPTQDFLSRYLARLLTTVEEQHGIILVATVEDAVCGFAAGHVEEDFERDAEYFYVAELIVSEARRGRGIGTALLQGMETFARANGYGRLAIGVLARNELTHNFFSGYGFREYAIEMMKNL